MLIDLLQKLKNADSKNTDSGKEQLGGSLKAVGFGDGREKPYPSYPEAYMLCDTNTSHKVQPSR